MSYAAAWCDKYTGGTDPRHQNANEPKVERFLYKPESQFPMLPGNDHSRHVQKKHDYAETKYEILVHQSDISNLTLARLHR